MCVYIYIYLHNAVNDLSCTHKNVFDDDKKRVLIEDFLSCRTSRDMSLVNELGNVFVGHGEEAEIKVNIYGNTIAKHGEILVYE